MINNYYAEQLFLWIGLDSLAVSAIYSGSINTSIKRKFKVLNIWCFMTSFFPNWFIFTSSLLLLFMLEPQWIYAAAVDVVRTRDGTSITECPTRQQQKNIPIWRTTVIWAMIWYALVVNVPHQQSKNNPFFRNCNCHNFINKKKTKYVYSMRRNDLWRKKSYASPHTMPDKTFLFV